MANWNNTNARPIPIEQITIEKLASIVGKAKRVGDCLIHPNKHHTGYAHIRINGQKYSAHRIIKAVATGTNPTNLVTDHLCRTKNCIRPSHLEFVENLENVRRGVSWDIFRKTVIADKKNQTHCKNGHEFTETNTRISVRKDTRPGTERRSCRECHRLTEQRRRDRAKSSRQGN